MSGLLLVVLLSAITVCALRSCDAWVSTTTSHVATTTATTTKRSHPALSASGRAVSGALFQSSTALDPDRGGDGGGVPSSSSRPAAIALRIPAGSSFANSTTITSSSSEALPIDAYCPKHGELAADLTPIAFGSPPDAIVLLEEEAEDAVLVIDDTQLPLHQLALAGSFTTALADVLVHPMDCIKTLQQHHLPLGFGAAARQLYDAAGPAGFYHGFLTYAGADAVSGAIKFAVWEVWKQRVVGSDGNNVEYSSNNSNHNVPLLLTGAALAFLASSVTLVPGEVLKQALQMEQYHSFQDAIRGIYQQNSNLSGFYTGYPAVLCRDVPYTALELTLYELFKRFTAQVAAVAASPTPQQRQQQQHHGEPEGENVDEDTLTSTSTSNEILAAIVTGAFAATLTNPSDVVKTQMMMNTAEAPSASSSLSPFLDCFANIAAEHGPLAFFAGATARVAWIVPFTAVYLPTYDALKRWLWKRHVRQTTAATQVAAEPQPQPEPPSR